MPIKIDIPDNQIDRLKEMYTSLAKEILARLEKAQQEWSDIQPTLSQLGIKITGGARRVKLKPVDNKPDIVQIGADYNTNWNWTQKATYVLKLKQKPLTAKEILDVLLTELETTLDRTKAINSLPSTLSVQARKNNFSRVLENGEYIYDLIKKEE